MRLNAAAPCINYADLSPVFRDLNGDGRLDLIVAEPLDPTVQAIDNVFETDGVEVSYSPFYTSAPSHAWLWRPTGWDRAAEFDLPMHHAHIRSCSFCGFNATTSNGPDSTTEDAGVRFADFNRDGFSDVVWTEYPYGGFSLPLQPPRGVLLNRGRGDGSPYSAWCSSVPLSGPDGGVDLCPPSADASRYEPPEGEKFAGEAPNPNGYNTESLGLVLIDLNGDGWTDYARADPFGASPEYVPVYRSWLYSPTDGWIPDDRFVSPVDLTSDWCHFLRDPTGARLQDVNGDGTADLLKGLSGQCEVTNESFVSRVHERSDLLREARNGRGGTIEFSYDSAARQRDRSGGGLEDRAADDAALRNEPPGDDPGDVVRWTTRPVVSEVTVTGLNTTPATTRYRYAHPRYCRETRTSLGFRLVERTRPDGSVVEHYFYQHHGRAGRTSARLLFEDAALRHEYRETWKLPSDGWTVPADAFPGTIAHPDVHVGRRVTWVVRTFYGDPGSEVPGPGRYGIFRHDDVYGYNFVDTIEEVRPNALHVVQRDPEPVTAVGVVGLVQERREYGQALLRRTSFSYTAEGRPATRTDWVEPRGASGEGDAEVTTFAYDAFGNLERITRPTTAAGLTRVTRFRYDGDTGCGAGNVCPEGHDSHSLRVGIKDPSGSWTLVTPHELLPEPAIVASPYSDEPTVTREYDAFGRLKGELLGEGPPVKVREINYYDTQEPSTETLSFVDEAGTDWVRSAVYHDGFGGPWRRVEEVPGDVFGVRHYSGRAVFHDPVERITRETFELACGSDPSCSGLTGETEAPATTTTRDVFGRVVRVDTPEGFSVTEHAAGSISGSRPPGLAAGPYDVAYEKNAKGDLVRRFRSGDRVVLVQECDPTTAGDDTPLPSCTNPDETFYTYEVSGELSTIYDARAAATSVFNDPDRYLRYHYDTLGRVVRIDDPDLSGPTPYTLTDYDAVGNVVSVTNARGEERVFTYDLLDRLTHVDTPPDEADYDLYYLGTRQPWLEGSAHYTRTYAYDGLGRVERESLYVAGASVETGGSVGTGVSVGTDTIVSGDGVVATEGSVGLGGAVGGPSGIGTEVHGTVTNTEVEEVYSPSDLLFDVLFSIF